MAYSIDFITQDSSRGRASTIFQGISRLVSTAEYDQIRVAVAYATRAGTRNLLTELERRMAGWEEAQKQWLISMDFGRSDPESFQLLSHTPNSVVRVPDGQYVLDTDLRPRKCFHPKTYVLRSGDRGDSPVGIFSGSANLSMSGLHGGSEHATSMIWSPPLSDSEQALLNSVERSLDWWLGAWADATPATEEFVDAYAQMKEDRNDEDDSDVVRVFAEADVVVVEADEGVGWREARVFWVQTAELYKNLGADRPGNQLDLRRGTRVFFGFPPDAVARNTVLGQVELIYGENEPQQCSIRFGNNSMDKLNLPVPGDTGPNDYDNKYLHFERAGQQRFQITLGDEEAARVWRDTSRTQGMLHNFAGGREYGFFA